MPSRRRWIARLAQAAVVGLLAADTAQLRRRLAALPVLRDQPATPAADGRAAVAHGVRLDQSTLAAAEAYRQREQLAALDLVPADLTLAQALDLLRDVDPATYRGNRLAGGRTAAHAIAADPGLLDQVGVPARPDGADLAAAALEIKLRAPADTAFAVAPGLAASAAVREQDPAIQHAVHGAGLELHVILRAAVLAALAATALTGRKWAAGLLLAWSAQPLAVFAGSRTLKPADLVRGSLTRVIAEPGRLVRTLTGTAGVRAERAAAIETSRIAYREDMAAGLGRFFEPPRRDCPWCGGTELRRRLLATDLHTHKPGQFVLDDCVSCGHVFQNPRLNAAGLEFYYRDAYDGLNEHAVQSVFATRRAYFLSQARALSGHAKPERWLDVGTGHAHFCNQAKEIWPQTSFDGIDLSSGVELAQRRGRIDRAYRGFFPDLAPSMAGAYDAVSMFHYLEHVTDPVAELRAAHTALKPGGHLVIEVPDPECRFSTLLGRYWGGWLQPQHLNMYPVDNLRGKLGELGFTVVGTQHREAGAPDLTVAAWLLANRFAPRSNQPWHHRAPGLLQRAARGAALTAAAPLLLAAVIGDRLIEPATENLRLCNAYRVIARRD
ncbi:methyltransferase domain-containing protein [Crossiella sp. CA198]|uniref:class I SAM-dependent methyltransferase n=1 Tax=Crossiella sp. CA198 TaxID=3455607 RepID=UPI003F8D02E9